MRWWAPLLLVVALCTRAHAVSSQCAGQDTGTACKFLDYFGTYGIFGYCRQSACIHDPTVPQTDPFTGFGTISSSGGTINGTNTLFTVLNQPGQVILAAGQIMQIVTVTDDVTLTVFPGPTPALSNVTFTVLEPAAVWTNGVTPFAALNGNGSLALGSNRSSGARLDLWLAQPPSVTVGNGTDLGPFYSLGGYTSTLHRAGDTSAVGAQGGNGRTENVPSVAGGNATGVNGIGGAPGEIDIETGPAGAAPATGGTGGAGGVILINPAPPGLGGAANGAVGVLFLSQFGGLVSIGGFNRDGSDATLLVNADTGDITRLHGVAVSFPSTHPGSTSFLQQATSGAITDVALSADTFTQYFLLAGRSGGQSPTCGTASGDGCTFSSTSHATKGKTTFDTNALVIDGVNKRIGNVASPGVDEDFAHDSSFVSSRLTASGNNAAQFIGRSSAGTLASPTSVGSGTVLAGLSGCGYDATNGVYCGVGTVPDGGVEISADGAFSGTSHATQICEYTTATNALVRTKQGCIRQDGSREIIGIVSKYKNIATVGNGQGAEYATVDLTTQAAAITATTLYAVPSTGAGQYRICWVASVTRAASTSSVLGGTNGFQLKYTDADDSVVKTLPGTIVAGIETNATNSTATGTISQCWQVNAKASTNIQYQIDYTSVGVTTMQFNLHIRLEAL